MRQLPIFRLFKALLPSVPPEYTEEAEVGRRCRTSPPPPPCPSLTRLRNCVVNPVNPSVVSPTCARKCVLVVLSVLAVAARSAICVSICTFVRVKQVSCEQICPGGAGSAGGGRAHRRQCHYLYCCTSKDSKMRTLAPRGGQKGFRVNEF